MRLHKHTLLYQILFGLLLSFLFFSTTYAQQATLTQENTPVTRVAAGDLLPVTVKLTNFGSSRRVDVQITYRILDAQGGLIYTEHETIAVDTTANLIKQLQVPPDVRPGIYRAESNIQYPDQVDPASSSFEFTVERAIFGIFVSDLLLYGALALALGTLCFFAGRFLIRARSRRSILHDYSDKPKEDRIYYEIISDTITQMRQRVGDKALDIAMHTDGLVADETGLVVDLVGHPAKVVAELVSGYEKAFGRKASFSLRKEK